MRSIWCPFFGSEYTIYRHGRDRHREKGTSGLMQNGREEEEEGEELASLWKQGGGSTGAEFSEGGI